MTDVRRNRLRAWMNMGSEIYAGDAARGCLGAEALYEKARAGIAGRPWAGGLRKGAYGLSSVYCRVRPGRLATREGAQAGHPGSVRRASGTARLRAPARLSDRPPTRSGSDPRTLSGQFPRPSPPRPGWPEPSSARAHGKRPASRSDPGAGLGGGSARAAAPPDRRRGLYGRRCPRWAAHGRRLRPLRSARLGWPASGGYAARAALKSQPDPISVAR